MRLGARPALWAVVLAAIVVCLAGCGLASAVGSASVPSPTVEATGYALANVAASSGRVALYLSLLVNGRSAAGTAQTLTAAVEAAEAALRSAGAPAAAVGVEGAPSLTAQVGPAAVEAAQTVVVAFPSNAAAMAVVDRLQLETLAGYDGYYLAPLGVSAPAAPAETRADAQALAQARALASRLAAAEGRVLGALRTSRVALLSTGPCAPISGCASASGQRMPSPGPNQVVVSVDATFATRAAG
jgi:hypothetical protein